MSQPTRRRRAQYHLSKPMLRRRSLDVLVYTDGSCFPNPGPGGWAALHVTPDRAHILREIHGAAPAVTTNNRMEILAAIEGLRALPHRQTVGLFTDSRYVLDAIQYRRIPRWQANAWKKVGTIKSRIMCNSLPTGSSSFA